MFGIRGGSELAALAAAFAGLRAELRQGGQGGEVAAPAEPGLT